MNNKLQENLNLFVSNNNDLKGAFVWHEPMTKRLASLVYALEGKTIDNESIKKAHEIIKAETGVFSTFRGNLAVYIAAMLAMTDNPKEKMQQTLEVYNMMKASRFYASDYLVAASFEVASQSKPENFQMVVDRAREFFLEMKKNNRFLIGSDDYIFCAMLALSDLEPHAGANKMKKIFRNLKKEFFYRSSILTLSQMLVLGGKTDECVANILHLNRTLRGCSIRLDKAYTLPSLGVLSMVSDNHDKLATDIEDSMGFLREQKGFGRFSVSSQEILLYVVSIICNVYADEMKDDLSRTSLSSGITNMIIAQQTAMLVAITSASIAASSAASC